MKMECVSVVLTHGGSDNMMKVRLHSGRPEVTPAELLLLEILHGEGSCKVTAKGKTVERGAVEEKERLVKFYGCVPGSTPAEHKMKKIDAAFPGAKPSMPSTFAEIDVDTSKLPVIGVEAKTTEKKAQAKTAAKANTTEPKGDAGADEDDLG